MIRVNDAGEARSDDVNVVEGANAIALAPDGEHAVIYYDAERTIPGELFGDFQSVSVVSMQDDPPTAHTISVGFKPTNVFFEADGSRAFVITETGISTLDFAAIAESGSGIAPRIPFADGGTGHGVWVTLDGRYALVHETSTSRLKRVDLNDGTETTLDVSELFPLPEGESLPESSFLFARRITDLDLNEARTELVATIGGMEAVLRIPVPGGFDDLNLIERVSVPDHDIERAEPIEGTSRALLYRHSAASERVSLVDFAQPDVVHTVELKKGVARIHLSDDGSAALIVHKRKPGNPSQPNLDVETRIDRAEGYTLLRLDTLATQLEITDVPIASVTVVPDSHHAFLLFRHDGLSVREVARVSFDEFVVDPLIRLDSAPVSAGVVPGSGRVFIHQEHPDGRLTFVNWEDASIETVTGFDLNSRIKD